MTNDAKEWVTVKIEAPVREEAKDDPRTYTQIMQAGLKATSHADGSVSVKGETPAEEGVAVGDLRDQLDRIESAAKEATNAAQNAERAAEEIQR